MLAAAYSARTNYFRAKLETLHQALADHPTIVIRSHQDDLGDWWHALTTHDMSYATRRSELMELGLHLARLIDPRDAIAAFLVGFHGADRLFGTAVLLNHQGEVGRVDLTDIYRIAGDDGIVLRAAED